MPSKRGSVFWELKKPIFSIGILSGIMLLFLIANIHTSYGITFSNYTSQKYHIQFQYPSTWQVTEKMNRFDEGTDLKVNDPVSYAFVIIIFSDNLITGFGSPDLTTGVYDSFKKSIDDYSYDYDIIEQPTFTSSIDAQRAGTYVYAFKEKYEDYAQRWGSQNWIVFVGDTGYYISFNALASQFDSPENTQIRNQLIKSIKFLGQSNTTNTNITNFNRFAE
jgi:hypothetical protein